MPTEYVRRCCTVTRNHRPTINRTQSRPAWRWILQTRVCQIYNNVKSIWQRHDKNSAQQLWTAVTVTMRKLQNIVRFTSDFTWRPLRTCCLLFQAHKSWLRARWSHRYKYSNSCVCIYGWSLQMQHRCITKFRWVFNKVSNATA